MEPIEVFAKEQKAREVQYACDHLDGELIFSIDKNNGNIRFDENYMSQFPEGLESVKPGSLVIASSQD